MAYLGTRVGWTVIGIHCYVSSWSQGEEKLLTLGRPVLPHAGLDHFSLDGTANTQLVVVWEGAASSALLVQVGVGRL